MALTSVFYDGPVTETDRAKNRAGAPDYGVYGASDFQVITNGSVPYSVLVRAGRAHGWGITDTAATNQTLTFDAPASGVTRWDLVAVRRNWQPLLGGPSTLVVIKGGAFTNIPAGRKTNPGIEDDQPLALVGWKGGQSAPFQIIDLRCWASNGGMEIANEIAFEYLGRPGACVRLDGWDWRFARQANGAWTWVTDTNATQVDPGLMSPNDKKKLDGATFNATPNSLVWRGSSGSFYVPAPTSATMPTPKSYVDSAISAARTYAASVAASARSAAEAYARSLTANLRRAAGGERFVGALEAGASYPNQKITFPAGRFSAPPSISITPSSSRQSIGIQSVSKTECLFTCSNWTAAYSPSGNVIWVAVQD